MSVTQSKYEAKELESEPESKSESKSKLKLSFLSGIGKWNIWDIFLRWVSISWSIHNTLHLD